jgi:hypothetical protein
MNEIRTNRREQMLRKAESKSIVPPADKPKDAPAEIEESSPENTERWLLNGSVPIFRRLDVDSPRRMS